ncbi:hypothetical protein [Pseudomonas carassii]|uniref:Inner membrane protein n=1 Tax=Pseudomonas carassii TaxID=3115855 RepID=A0ABU7H8Q1_9PSED|nr:hypothetical protein [Pseudomonas sp. 137P]MEE1886966.1 hypothetical protein [Pseudomonas sp. 137P]
MLLLAATSMLLHWTQQPKRYRHLIGYGLLITIGLYTHYFTMLAVAAHWFYLLLFFLISAGRLIRQRGWWVCNVMIAFAYLPWLPSLIAQLANVTWVGWLPAVTFNTLPSTLWVFLTLNDGLGYSKWLFWLAPMVLVVACVKIALSDKRPSRPTWLILSALCH